MKIEKKQKIGLSLIVLVAITAIAGPYIADWNATHIYNANWPPHAKFHNAQTMLLGSFLGLSSLWFVWRTLRSNAGQRIYYHVSILLAAGYWITQSLSILFPGTAFTDPEFKNQVPYLLGLPVQLFIDLFLFILLTIAYFLKGDRKLQKRTVL